mmetsp:Transcript_39311/g.108432  ORF Transcript_39311/g.108432 Transcript_39311/m.108432 type:complete len:322 (+) Transcript_39311:68-1033(+)
MPTFDVRVEEGGLGVKLSPEPLSSKVTGLRVVAVNVPAKAERAMLQVGDVLLAVNGTTFADAKEFLQWVRLPPYLLTVLRDARDEAEARAMAESASGSGGASSSSGHPPRASSSSGGAVASTAGVSGSTCDATNPGDVDVLGVLALAMQKRLPEMWKIGHATGVENNCLLDSLLQLLQPELDADARQEKARACRTALVEEGLCAACDFLRVTHVPRLLALMGASPETATVCVLGFAELQQELAPERTGSGTERLLVLAGVSRHSHFAPVFTGADPRIAEGLCVVGALQDSQEREEALDGLLAELLGYGRGGQALNGGGAKF